MDPVPPSASDLRALDNLRAVLDSGTLSGYRVSAPNGGRWCQHVESELASRLGFMYAVLCNSATTGIYLALRATGVGPHDRVILPAYTMAGTAGAVLMTGATPILCDVNPNNGLVEPAHVSEALREDTGMIVPSALIAVDVHGGVIPTQILKKAFPGLTLISDCAQAFDHIEEFSGLRAGAHSDFAVFSFKQGKQMSCGEGGVVCTNDTGLYRKLLLARNHGDVKDDTTFGGNLHMTELEAAVLAARLDFSDDLCNVEKWSRRLVRALRKVGSCFSPGPVNGPPFIFWLLSAGHEPPKGFVRGYHTPLCCLPYYKRELKQGCLLSAHVFNHNMCWTKPPRNQEDLDRILGAVVEATKGCHA